MRGYVSRCTLLFESCAGMKALGTFNSLQAEAHDGLQGGYNSTSVYNLILRIHRLGHVTGHFNVGNYRRTQKGATEVQV